MYDGQAKGGGGTPPKPELSSKSKLLLNRKMYVEKQVAASSVSCQTIASRHLSSIVFISGRGITAV